MINPFENKFIYGEKWHQTERSLMSEEQKKQFDMAVVEMTAIGPSIAFHLKGGMGRQYMQLAKGEELGIGEVLDLNKIGLMELRRPGSEPTVRIHYPADKAWVEEPITE